MSRILVSNICPESHVTRSDGAVLRDAIEQTWTDEQPTTLDFSGLRVASVSFFDESIGVLARAHGRDMIAKRLRVEGIDANDRNLLNEIVSSRSREHEHAKSGDVVKRLLTDAGVPGDVLARWDGMLLALYQNHSGLSASADIAQRIAREKAQADGWTLDLGHYATALSSATGATLKDRLDQLGITYQTRSLTQQWQRVRRPSASP